MNNEPGDFHLRPDVFAAPKPTTERNPETYRKAAKASMTLPVIGAVTAKLAMMAIQDHPADVRRWGTLAAAAIFGVMVLAGVVMGIIALYGALKVGVKDVLGKAAGGIFVSLALLTLFAMGFYRGRQNAVAARELKESLTDLKDELRQDLDKNQEISLNKQDQRFERMKDSLDKASKNATGDQALITKAGSGFLNRMQAESKQYVLAAIPLTDGSLLDMSTVKKREDLAAKREQTKHFMAANEKLLAFINNQEKIVREELAKQPLSPEARQSALEGFLKSFAKQAPLQEGIRIQDRRMATATLAIIDLLDANWGRWTCNQARGPVNFNDDTIRAKFLNYSDEIQSASAEQLNLQRKLLSQK